MKGKKESNSKAKTDKVADTGESFGKISTKADLKSFLNNVRDKMADGVSAPIYAMSAVNHVLNHPSIYQLLDNETKEIARDIWLRLKQSGLQVRNPALLFTAEENGVGTTAS